MSANGMVSLPVYVADAFVSSGSNNNFTGNPAGVVVLPPGLSLREEAYRAIAAELRHSETAFLSPISTGRYALRWFTPTNEVPLCGHATLAGARCSDDLNASTGEDTPERYVFETASGELVVTRDSRVDAQGLYWLEFPRNPPEDTWQPDSSPRWAYDIISALGLPMDQVAISRVTEVAVSYKAKKLLVICRGIEGIKTLQPDERTLYNSHREDIIRGVSVMCYLEQRQEMTTLVYSRYFAPWNGIPEDPVNGSSHTVIAPYISSVIGTKG
ncbi:phenazine biosynthesis protein, putative [Perkinsus marinus ATCC 50983]|uniref:Phenazine biosynthesis protein, putative n=1 Tax=Perkinsus marinus (strain ATCC 50983 / TXsc) TaxID=423536 RepID=C5LRV8_PERM5|nr:phenazine biosynthesis protein, putative [Perkinsus marinus ATCC 50983]EER00535.1 phenazine biosynthesis protein, putative [Perkinsus marinus ATCC 50983]|eukprot:XP_002767817.1 phenazine biosynthesis protein, putative [Perkinsus marinus ATCC 50983]